MAHALPLMQQGSLRQALTTVQAPRDTFNRANAGASGSSGKASTSQPMPTTEVAPPRLAVIVAVATDTAVACCLTDARLLLTVPASAIDHHRNFKYRQHRCCLPASKLAGCSKE